MRSLCESQAYYILLKWIGIVWHNCCISYPSIIIDESGSPTLILEDFAFLSNSRSLDSKAVGSYVTRSKLQPQSSTAVWSFNLTT